MFVSLRMLRLPPDRANERAAVAAALADAVGKLPAVRSSWVAPVSPVAVINAGDVVWRMVHASEREALAVRNDPAWKAHIAPILEGIEISGVGYRIAQRHVRPAGAGIWRALIFRCFPHADAAMVQRLRETTLLLPKYVEEIRSWALSSVAWNEGVKQFEFVWEQEYDDLAGLTGPYMTSPVHWGIVDAFFDADCPEYIVDPQLIQVVGSIDSSIME